METWGAYIIIIFISTSLKLDLLNRILYVWYYKWASSGKSDYNRVCRPLFPVFWDTVYSRNKSNINSAEFTLYASGHTGFFKFREKHMEHSIVLKVHLCAVGTEVNLISAYSPFNRKFRYKRNKKYPIMRISAFCWKFPLIGISEDL